MGKKKKFELEFILNTSAGILYKQISTPSGLSEWFADDVHHKEEGTFIFVWEGTEETAHVLSQKKDEFIRFQWDSEEDEEAFFELRIRTDPITHDVALIISDFAEEEEEEEAKLLWESQVEALKHVIGA